MRNAVIVDVVRTPSGRGKPGGALSGVHAVDLLALVLDAVTKRNALDPAKIDDVIAGCVVQAGEQSLNIGRAGVLAAGWPEGVPATTVDRQCGSSQQALHFAAQAIMSGTQDVVIACGVESMSRVPMGSNVLGADTWGPRVRARFPDGFVNQGVAAELVAERWKLSRTDLDEYAARSHRLAALSAAGGGFDAETIPVAVATVTGLEVDVTTDETLRASTTVETLAALHPSFQNEEMESRFPDLDWKVTPGNSSPLTDGASAALMMGEDVAARLGLRPRAIVRHMAVAGGDPFLMLTAPVDATRRVLARAGLTTDEIDAFEVNEAFASVPLMWSREMGVDVDRLNPRGGAIALGHPLGASGLRVLATMLNHLEQNDLRYGLQTICEAGGLANALIVERVKD
ncbi:thiolase family protein [Nocardioides marmoriginsengisoli]|uniref:Thiolase family protein n=1 Tax=Nocardioides marmoriginsengisoli TaxID=661483 RepID=A0A3N0CHT2_9ACTN|nr:thiolase family protein [Nocardioides marmoriginsengisoli]RNL62851.1 thiolase family protein [Nocardioides marmoriginsengisoli]